ncbi:peptidase A24 [Haloarcula taiwanensis]|uniref:Peptidase A24 n=1 Tax=Haloarcula taiwanensis TaxID=1932004 RepID=A0A2H5A1U3_9EURY|nr:MULTISPECIES: A24 family peptidase [Haloarcula]AUG48647.1 peptidase A24 [Haloarcula taiwanensis]RLM39979.1 prepilin peptidase [Haloarcula sp. Atlit-120R]RLM47990.1 prepilin peptidase [Haloarcula sp. Atlit-47R]RLM96395.1 A24 family peptidase [Haloarcula sp. Atlit-7R]
MLGSIPDLLRLVAVPVFGWAAYRDVKTRRVPNRTWTPLAALAVVLLLWDAYTVWTGPTAVGQRLFLIRVAISLGFVIPLSYGFWLIGGFGGADAKAFMLVAVLFPVYPVYYLPTVALPLQQSAIGVFSLTILSNTVLAGVVYPLAVAAGNLARGRFSLAMFIGRPVSVSAVTEEYGRLLESPDGFDRGGLDLDALRMYLQWRGCSLADIRADPDRHRLPTSLPRVPNDPGDGSLATDGGDPVADDVNGTGGRGDDASSQAVTDDTDAVDDPWGAERFLDDIDHSAYGTSPAQLRDGLDVLVEQDEVWISPGIPFLVPMFAGLVVSLTYGDVLFSLLQAVGLA